MKDLDYNIDDEVSEVYVILAMRILYVTGGEEIVRLTGLGGYACDRLLPQSSM